MMSVFAGATVCRVASGAASNYGAVWRELGGATASGKAVLQPESLLLEGTSDEGTFLRRELPYTEIVSVRIGREASERLHARPTLILECASAPTLQMGVLGPGMLFELADLLTTLTLEQPERLDSVVLVVPLEEGVVEEARALAAGGPPFDPTQWGLERHEVFFTSSEAVFLFEGRDAGRLVAELVQDPAGWRAALRWKELLAAPPRLGESAYSWARRNPSA
jgi:hypothetical protein